MHVLGVRTCLCGSFGGEAGAVAATLIAGEGLGVRTVGAAGANGTYIHDRRSGERVALAEVAPSPLSRHEVELYGIALVEGLEADICVLGGPVTPEVLPADTYRRLAADLTANGRRVVADLSGEPLAAVLAGGITVLKVSHEELLAEGRAADDSPAALVAAMEALTAEGAANVVVSRAGDPTLAMLDGRLLQTTAPTLDPLDTRGAGDSLTAGLTAGLARGLDLDDAVRLGVAAGSSNVTRRGMATGHRDVIERLVDHVEVASFDGAG